ncbi:MAG: hypothetical protein Q8P82_00880 [bacterium]|nr:hypothetical protein [bacterium]
MAQKRSAQSWDDGLRLISVCPLCEAQYNPLEAHLIDEEDNSHLLHITCIKCSHAVLARVLVSSGGISSVGLVTDLSYDDVVKFRDAEEVKDDEVLALHGLLDTGKNFWKLLN